jgi:hypothetical protein
MEDKRGSKCERSHSAEGSHLLGDAETPPPTPSGSPPPLGSPSAASSCCPCSLVSEQGNASKKIPMLEPSSFIVDTTHDEEIIRKLSGDLNHDILRPFGDGKIIILDDSNDNVEAQEETTIEIDSTVAPASIDDAPVEARVDNSGDQGPDQEANGGNNRGHNIGDP